MSDVLKKYLEISKDVDSLYDSIKDLHTADQPWIISESIIKMLEKINDWDENHKSERNNPPKALQTAATATERNGETVLHTAVRCLSFKNEEEKCVLENILGLFPDLILEDRKNTSDYTGQTPIHMAICKNNVWLTKKLIATLKKKEEDIKYFFRLKATGSAFRNTIMMGGLPLSIAALTFNKKMFNLLIDEGAGIDDVNQRGDNVIHSLIRYAHLHPERMNDVIKMFEIVNDIPAHLKKKETAKRQPRSTSENATRQLWGIWVMENNTGRKPLQLAASYGLHQIFSFIMELKVYCFADEEDGLFDIKNYDVTELDAISSMQQKTEDKRQFANKSVLMELMDRDPSEAFKFIMFQPLRRIITQKWDCYRKYFFPWCIVHFLFMCILTWYGIERSLLLTTIPDDVNKTVETDSATTHTHADTVLTEASFKDPMFATVSIISILVAIMYIAQEIVRKVKGKMELTWHSIKNPYDNSWFRILFCLFSFSLFVDVWATFGEYYENYCLITSIICGWFLCIFFLRAWSPFSFFTVLIQKSLMTDVFRFSIVLSIELIAFGSAMFMALQGSTASQDSGFNSFQSLVFSMFTLMLGLGDTPSIYDTRQPILAILIMFAFIIMTTLLMINALIALMGQTCIELLNYRHSRDQHLYLQRLSIVLYFDSILPQCLIEKGGTISKTSPGVQYHSQKKRYVIINRSEIEDHETDEDNLSNTHNIKTTILEAFDSLHKKTLVFDKKAKYKKNEKGQTIFGNESQNSRITH